jgi:hypothetical protein
MANCSTPAAQACTDRKPLYIVTNMTIAKHHLKAGSRNPLARQWFGKHRFSLQWIC